uniref:Uncharacterized protein n=2 Tax=Physcomitrium patens TaxID=3218 RepID=A0A7I4FG64_PHYPA
LAAAPCLQVFVACTATSSCTNAAVVHVGSICLDERRKLSLLGADSYADSLVLGKRRCWCGSGRVGSK